MTPKSWLVLSVRVPAEELADELAEALIGLGGTAVEEESSWLTTYIAWPRDVATFVARARRRLERRLDEGLDLRWRCQDHEDWAQTWKRGLEPRRVGQRLIVAPTWKRPRSGPADLVILIDPEMAFGTGEHATTRGVLRLLERSLRCGDRVLDVGTGSGILAIAAARLGAGRVLAIDSDPEAVETARANVERNGVDTRIELREGLVDAALLAGLGPASFDLITANVLSGVLVPLLPPLGAVLAAGGRAILGGILAREAEQVAGAAVAAAFQIAGEDREEEWWSVLLERRG